MVARNDDGSRTAAGNGADLDGLEFRRGRGPASQAVGGEALIQLLRSLHQNFRHVVPDAQQAFEAMTENK